MHKSKDKYESERALKQERGSRLFFHPQVGWLTKSNRKGKERSMISTNNKNRNEDTEPIK